MKLYYRLAENGHQQLEQIQHQLEQTDLTQVKEVEISLEEVDVPNSGFLRQLLQLRIYLRRHEVALRLTDLSDSSIRVIQQSSLHRFLDPITAEDAR